MADRMKEWIDHTGMEHFMAGFLDAPNNAATWELIRDGVTERLEEADPYAADDDIIDAELL